MRFCAIWNERSLSQASRSAGPSALIALVVRDTTTSASKGIVEPSCAARVLRVLLPRFLALRDDVDEAPVARVDIKVEPPTARLDLENPYLRVLVVGAGHDESPFCLRPSRRLDQRHLFLRGLSRLAI